MINKIMENDEIDDEATTRILDHILIRDPRSGEVLVDKRGTVIPPLATDNFDNLMGGAQPQ